MAHSYRFGELLLDGRTYTRDLIVLPDRVIENWWRRQGHSLCLDDLADVPLDDLDALVIGTGASGVMQVPDDLIRHLTARGLQVVVRPTAEALEVFDHLRRRGMRVAGAFHLTC